ncbi:hypothetical protein T01_8945 [Trichinella spiralis]|uniref:Uncharacterized protein n=1 Tax=Trichinella spiralis TaxID=6334 RepID=A0A0V1BIT4_TRISP|nr:hypothetical protein T01_8945 [Trichinella spiralis]
MQNEKSIIERKAWGSMGHQGIHEGLVSRAYCLQLSSSSVSVLARMDSTLASIILRIDSQLAELDLRISLKISNLSFLKFSFLKVESALVAIQ